MTMTINFTSKGVTGLARTDIANIDEMLCYEKVDKKRVYEIEQDMSRRGKLLNPVIYDPSERLLVDGHHRVEAFRQLGLRSIATFNVDYFSKEVMIKNWYRILSKLDIEILKGKFLSFFNATSKSHEKEPEDNYYIVLNDLNGLVMKSMILGAVETSKKLQVLCAKISQEGGKVRLAAKKPRPKPKQNHIAFLSIQPTIGKRTVISVAQSDELFEYQVNRHLIENRPLGIGVPIDIFSQSKTTALRKYNAYIQDLELVSAQRKRWHEERFYEENTLLFSCLKENNL